MHRHDDEIKNDRLMAFSPRPVLLHENSHPLWGFRGFVITADRTGIFPFKMVDAVPEGKTNRLGPTNHRGIRENRLR